MENASKALIIAGAILISILLISVGIMIMNSTSGIQDQMGAQMSATEVQTFNAQFTPYMGNGKTAAQVRSLFEAVTSSNANNAYKVSMKFDTTDLITVDTSGKATITSNASTTLAGLDKSKRYTIEISQNDLGIYTSIQVNK